MTNKEVKSVSELYKAQYEAYKSTGFNHTHDVLKGMREVLKALEVDFIALENEIDSKSMRVFEADSYDNLTRIFSRYNQKSFKWTIESVEDILNDIEFDLTEEDLKCVKASIKIIHEYRKAA